MGRERVQPVRSGAGLHVVQGVLKEELLPPADPRLFPTIATLRIFSRSETDSATAAIVSVPDATHLVISGNHAAKLLAAQIAVIDGSTGNNGQWLIVDATYALPNTTLEISRDLPSLVADGTVRLPEMADTGIDEIITNRDPSLRLAAGTWLTAIAVAGEMIPIVPGCVRVMDPADLIPSV